MKRERKLRLVTGGGGQNPPPDEPMADTPPTDEEIAAAAKLRAALDAGEEPLVLELQAAYVPGPLAPADLDAIVNRALGDDAAATAAERAAGERLRAELAGETAETVDAELYRALRLAAHPTEITAERNAELVDAALSRVPFLRRRGPAVRRIAPVTMAALASVAALAAGAALFAGRTPSGAPTGPTAALVRARSADDLFDATTPFPRRGEESSRIDRIASSRSADLRRNRFAAWGVK